jgi:micrococcal nuclease
MDHRHLAVPFLILAMVLPGCPGRRESLHDSGVPDDASFDAGLRDAAILDASFDAGRRDAGPLATQTFSDAIAWNDDAVQAISPETLPRTSSPCAPPSLALVSRVLDGDTIDVIRSHDRARIRVRLIGVNSPEISHEGRPAECYSAEAATFTETLTNHFVWLTYDAECQDIYGRDLAYVWLGPQQGNSLSSDLWNRHLVRRGLARTLTIAPNDSFSDIFAADRRAAQNANIGLWSACP